jgi:hypothetical protein
VSVEWWSGYKKNELGDVESNHRSLLYILSLNFLGEIEEKPLTTAFSLVDAVAEI